MSQQTRLDKGRRHDLERRVRGAVSTGASGHLARAELARGTLPPDRLSGASCLDAAVREVRALPPATPALAQMMENLVMSLVHAGRAESAAALASEMMARFPLRPEVTRTLLGLSGAMPSEDMLLPALESMGETLMRTYDRDGAELYQWAQRIAYQLRRRGHHEAAACVLRTWRHRFIN